MLAYEVFDVALVVDLGGVRLGGKHRFPVSHSNLSALLRLANSFIELRVRLAHRILIRLALGL